jgi:hypothetical protein
LFRANLADGARNVYVSFLFAYLGHLGMDLFQKCPELPPGFGAPLLRRNTRGSFRVRHLPVYQLLIVRHRDDSDNRDAAFFDDEMFVQRVRGLDDGAKIVLGFGGAYNADMG